jgi:hypothetical protein
MHLNKNTKALHHFLKSYEDIKLIEEDNVLKLEKELKDELGK